MDRNLLKKHRFAIDCAIKYYVKNEPTGLSDYEFDKLEKAAAEDGVFIRDIALSKLKSSKARIKNRYIEKVPKSYADKSMYDAIWEFYHSPECPDDAYVEPKYDGSSIAVYFENGIPYQISTCGGSNKDSDEGGIDQTDKLIKYMPQVDPRIKAIQCEVLVDSRAVERPRQIANGILNSKDKYSEAELDDLLRIRCFRYYSDEPFEFLDTMNSLGYSQNPSGELNFCNGFIMRVHQLLDMDPNIVNSDCLMTPTGSFLIDGYVFYRSDGSLIKAIKFKNAGAQESVMVDSIRWNDLSESKDGFSANVILSTPVEIKGSMVYKPSSNGVNNLLKKCISPGAMVSVTLRGSTIPCVDQVFSPGNGDYNWPVCKCGTPLGKDDIYGNNLKCPNPMCSSRIDRMTRYIQSGRFSWNNIGCLDGYFIIDRFSFSKKVSDPVGFMNRLRDIVKCEEGAVSMYDLIRSLGLTHLQSKNLDLVINPAYIVLRDNLNNI